MYNTVVKLKLQPDAAQREALEHDLALCNELATTVADTAMNEQCFKNVKLRKHCYSALRDAGLASQTAQHVIKKVCDAYRSRATRARNGGYGAKDSKRYLKIMNSAIQFKPRSTQPFDRRNTSWDHTNQLVAFTFRSGSRITGISYTGREQDLNNLATLPMGECDVLRDHKGVWYVVVTLKHEQPSVIQPQHYLGVDLGIVQIAAVADERGALIHEWSGGAITLRRTKNRAIRTSLQKKGTRSAKRRLKARKKREHRFASDVNHQISKTIIATAQRTGSGVSIENLRGIRDRVRLRKPQRAMVHSWAFAQLGEFLTYKAARAGVELVEVDPRNTSRTCSSCGHIDRRSRKNQASFVCTRCSVSLNADHNAAINIARKGPARSAEMRWNAIAAFIGDELFTGSSQPAPV